MPRYLGASSKRDEANTPPTPEMSPKSGNLVRREVDVGTNQTILHLKYALQGSSRSCTLSSRAATHVWWR